jgi:hypothetical protein
VFVDAVVRRVPQRQYDAPAAKLNHTIVVHTGVGRIGIDRYGFGFGKSLSVVAGDAEHGAAVGFGVLAAEGEGPPSFEYMAEMRALPQSLPSEV